MGVFCSRHSGQFTIIGSSLLSVTLTVENIQVCHNDIVGGLWAQFLQQHQNQHACAMKLSQQCNDGQCQLALPRKIFSLTVGREEAYCKGLNIHRG